MSYKDFKYQLKTELFFGDHLEVNIADQIRKHGGSKVFILASRESDQLELVKKQLAEAGIPFDFRIDCKSDPKNTYIDEVSRIIYSEGHDFVFGIGGGSVIDASKAVALLSANESIDSIWDIMTYKKQSTEEALPVGYIVTIASTGSESNSSFVITNLLSEEKLIHTDESVYPKFSIMDPNITYTLNAWHTACGAFDIVSHLMEQYLHNDTYVDVSDAMILGVMKAVVKWAPVAVREPENYDARANLLWASSIAMNRILAVGHYENWVSHLIEHSLSAKYNITHGAGMAIVLSKYLKYSVKFDEMNRIGKMGRYVFDLEQEEADEAVLRFEEFITSIGLPLTLKDLIKEKVEEHDLEILVKNSLPFGEMKLEGFEPFGYQQAREIIESCI